MLNSTSHRAAVGQHADDAADVLMMPGLDASVGLARISISAGASARAIASCCAGPPTGRRRAVIIA